MTMKTYSGSCHCGAVRFEADLDLSTGTIRCNCSVCSKARAWFVPVPIDRVRLLAGGAAQTEYQWVPPGKSEASLHYRFCQTCGIRTFGQGGELSMPNAFYFVNVAVLDGIEPAELAASLRYVDGRNNRFDGAPGDTRLM